MSRVLLLRALSRIGAGITSLVAVTIVITVASTVMIGFPFGSVFAAEIKSPDARALQQTTPAATASVSETLPITGTATTSATESVSVTVTGTKAAAPQTVLPVATATPAANGASSAGEPQVSPVATPTATQGAAGPLVGTIIANRASSDARFFVEGQTYVLGPERSEGLRLPRDTAVLNLFNCSAATPETQDGCFWDPYLLRRDGFFEIYERPTNTGSPSLLLREAGAPPTDQVWVQNRTGTVESLVFRNEVIEIEPSSVKEFPVATGLPSILYVRSCISSNGQTVCEWSPKTLDAGMYYAMVDIEMPGSLPQSLISTIDLRPILSDGSEEAPAASTGMECVLLVPALNVRSGPGLQYEIIAKVRGTETEPGSVVVIGRNPDSQWLAVDGRIAPGGWIAGSSDYVRCGGDTQALALVEVSQPQIAQPQTTPVPVAVSSGAGTGITEPVAVAAAEPSPVSVDNATAEPAPDEGTSGVQGVPPGRSLLLVNNGFPFEIRFTLDQVYRPNEGPSEYDLQPGESISLVVFPGTIAFSASSPWSSLAGNAELTVEADQSLTMWVRFEDDPPGSGKWLLRWQ